MKVLMTMFLIGFLVFGVIGFALRINHDWNKLGVESEKLPENSTAKRDGRAMQLIKPDENHTFDAEKAERKAQRSSKHQLVFSILSGVCLIAAILCGALM